MSNETLVFRRAAQLPRGAAALLAWLVCWAPQLPAEQPATDAKTSAEPAAEKPHFDILEYRVLGDTTLPDPEIERAVYAALGPGKTIDDVEQARQSLEEAYHAAGYGTVFVDIPEQHTDDGVVRLRVTEGRVARVNVSGARYYSNGEIRSEVPALRTGEVPNLPAVQSQLSALNSRSPDRRVTPVLKAGATPGTLDVDLKVEDKLPLHGSLELNNRYTADTSPLRLTAAVSYDNLFQKQHSASLIYQTAPENTDELVAIVGSYSFRVPSWDDSLLTLYAFDSNTDVATLGTLAVLGNGSVVGLRLARPAIERGGMFHSFAFAVEYKDFLENIRVSEDESLATPIDYLNWTAMYSGLRRGEGTTTAFNIGPALGIRGLSNESQEFAEKRYQGQANYLYLRGGLQHWQRLPHDLQLFVRLAAQASGEPLPSSEQFAIGGADSVRGYLEAAQLGDTGVSGGIELRSLWPAAQLGLAPESAYVFAFFDAGVVSVVDPLPDQDRAVSLSSFGLGVSAAWKGFDLGVDWAHALNTSGSVRAGDDRGLFSVSYGF
jgi:hemolysin activation/secretion protein